MGTYIPVTAAERLEMEKIIGFDTIDELFADIPEEMKLKTGLKIPKGMPESEVLSRLTGISRRNKVFGPVFRGAGIYDHYIPAIVEYITAKEEFVTAYTPYQPEISQGVLQSIFEYQTMICELTGLDVSNASVYDGATAMAEAVSMCRDKDRNTVLLSQAMHPQIVETVGTYCFGSGVSIRLIPLKDGRTDLEALHRMMDSSVAAVCISQPNFYGMIEEAAEAGAIAHAAGARFVMNCNPMSLAVLSSPAECGADIAVGDGQPLGIPMSFGGPTFGFMACTAQLLRKIPGRIVGETTDSDGKRAFVLTLQAREQHIRREKASSNICSNQSLCAMTAAVYLSVMGYDGLREAAMQSMSKAQYLAGRLKALEGFEPVFTGPFFNEFVTRSPIPGTILDAKLSEKGILGGLPLDGGSESRILWCTTEKNSREDIDRLVETLKEVCSI
ncbi:MAG: aminomethyl-transferring glycine dehydrogenase subunit GcvPA [Saccharofermentanales bacterium]